MELTSDIRLELVDEPSSHVSKEGMVDVQWSSETSLGMACRDLKHLNGMPLLHPDSVRSSGDNRKMPDGNNYTVFPWYLQITQSC